MVPDITFPATADSGAIIDSVRRHGVALVRAALPNREMTALCADVAAFYDAETEADHLQWIIVHGVAGPKMASSLLGLFKAVSNSIGRACAESYLNDSDIIVPLHHLLFRRRDAVTHQSIRKTSQATHNFHQDHDLIPTVFPLNMWLPLSTVDEHSTGLQFVLPHSTTVHPLPFDLESYLSRTGGAIWTPAMEPGDLLVFHHFTIHGTLVDPPKPKPRYSVEFRLGRRRDIAGYAEPVMAL